MHYQNESLSQRFIRHIHGIQFRVVKYAAILFYLVVVFAIVAAILFVAKPSASNTVVSSTQQNEFSTRGHRRVGLQDLFVMEFGVDLDRQLNGFAARSIRIDNYSNSWLYVESQVQRYVAPNTIGWVAICPTPQNRIVIRYADAPSSGTASVQTGTPPLVRVYEDTEVTAGDSEGVLYASGLPERLVDYSQIFIGAPGVEAGNVPLGNVVGQRYRVFGWSIAKDQVSAAVAPEILRVHLQNQQNLFATNIGELGIGQNANPTDSQELSGGVGIAGDVNSGVQISYITEPAGNYFIHVSIIYTLETP